MMMKFDIINLSMTHLILQNYPKVAYYLKNNKN